MPATIADRAKRAVPRLRRVLSLGPALLAGAAQHAGAARFAGAAQHTGAVRLRVHSIQASAINLADGRGWIIAAITGPAGADLPFSIALAEEEDFREWALRSGDPCSMDENGLRFQGPGRISIDFRRAERHAFRPIRGLRGLGPAFDACVERLGAIQERQGSRIQLRPSPRGEGGESALRAPPHILSRDAVGRALAAGFGSLLRALIRYEELSAPTRRLVGLGTGSTPSGDDLLCGLLAAACCAVPACSETQTSAPRARLEALAEAILSELGSTTALSAAFLRAACAGHFSGSLLRLAEALAADDTIEALLDLELTCAFGHSSGADLATGFLAGAATLCASDHGGTPAAALKEVP